VPTLSHLTSCTPIKSNLCLANSLDAAVSQPALYKLLTFHVPNLMSLLHSVSRTRVSVQVRGTCSLTQPVFTVGICQHLAQLPSRRTTPYRLSATFYSIYSQLPSILEAIPPSATWWRAMPWWQGPTYHGQRTTCVNCKGRCGTRFCSGPQQCHKIRLDTERKTLR